MYWRWLYKTRLRFRSVFQRNQLERELDEELHFHIEQETTGHLGCWAGKELSRRGEHFRLVAGIAHQRRQGLPHGKVVIHDEHYWCHVRH